MVILLTLSRRIFRFLPQGDNGDDVLIADDYANRLYGGDGVDSCTASGSGNSVTGCEP